VHRPGVDLATYRSQVGRPNAYTTEPLGGADHALAINVQIPVKDVYENRYSPSITIICFFLPLMAKKDTNNYN